MRRTLKLRYILPTLVVLMLTLFLARFVTAGWQRMLLNTNSAEGDQAAYLQLGLDLGEHGKLTDGTRNPLYPALLASFATREWHYVTYAKFLSLILGLLTIVSIFYVGNWLFNITTGLLAAFLLSINMEFVIHSSFVLAESLLVLCILWAWFFMVRALRQPHQTGVWIAAGVLAGLTYQAKGTGQLVFVCFVLAVILLRGWRFWSLRNFWLFLAAYGIMALPLWIYNWQVFGNPIYNLATKHQMWMDRWEENFVSDSASLPTIWTYWQTHSWSEAWTREWQGLVDMRFFLSKMLWPTRTLTFDRFFLSPWSRVLAVILIGLIVIAHRPVKSFIRRHREETILAALLSIVFYVLFAWYLVIVPIPTRFILPLLPLLLLFIAAILVEVGRWVLTTPRLPRWSKVVAGVGVTLLGLVVGYWFVVTSLIGGLPFRQSPFVADSTFNSNSQQPLQWIRAGHSTDTVAVLWGPGHSLPTWYDSDKLKFVGFPLDIKTATDFEALLAGANVEYMVIDADMASRHRQVADELLGVREIVGDRVAFDTLMPGWALGFVYPDVPCQWCVFRRIATRPPAHTTSFILGDTIRLAGYDIAADNFHPGGNLTVTLYWQGIQQPAADYTVFTQLLGPDAQLHGQLDRQPLAGRWPTSRWLPEQEFVDKFVIQIGETAPVGEYQLLVGLYDLNTGVRLPATVDGERIPDNAIDLHQLAIE